MWFKRLLYFAYLCPYIFHCLATWGDAPAVNLRRVLIVQKCAIRIIQGVSRMDHVAPLAYNNNLLLSKLYELRLLVFMYKSCVLGYNAEMFENSGYKLLPNGFNVTILLYSPTFLLP